VKDFNKSIRYQSSKTQDYNLGELGDSLGC